MRPSNDSPLILDPAGNREHGWQLWNRTQGATSNPDAVADLESLLVHPYQLFRADAADRLGNVRASRSVPLLTSALNDRSEHVAAAAAGALAKIAGQDCLIALCRAFVEDAVENPHYLANALAHCGDEGFAALSACILSSSPTVRFFAARGLAATGRTEAVPFLEKLQSDTTTTHSGALVSTAAKAGLKSLNRRPDQPSAVSQ